MKNQSSRIVRYVLIAFAVLAGLLIFFVNKNLASLAEWVYPGSELAAHAVLLGVELLALFWFWRGLFGSSRHLLLMDGHSPEEKHQFSKELIRRFRGNALIREAGIFPESSEPETEDAYIQRCLALLNAKADEEIQQNAKRIFLATALTQNGRLDALIVFVSLCRLVWRVSRIYNQRPHPREISSLYWAVASSTFLALSIEELDIPTEISVGFGEAFHAMAPAGLTASLPFAGKVLQTFTSSTIDGAANCYLVLRAGIIARNAYAYGALQEERPSRAAVFKEAGSVLLSMSQTLVDKFAAALAENLAEAAKYAGVKTVQAGKDLVGGIGTSVGKVATGAVNVAQATGTGIARAGVNTGSTLGNAVGKAASGTVNIAKDTGQGIARAGGKAVGAVGIAAGKTVSATKRVLGTPFRLLKKQKKHQ